MRIITLTTDFGLSDWFVGTMKGVILGLCPKAPIIDITHAIAPGNIQAGAFALAASCQFYPRHTVHLAIVDPGVGSDRRAIAVRTENYFFVAPDNGVLSLALAREKVKSIHRLQNQDWFRDSVSRTFHGRDLFAPVAAHISRGLALAQLGPACEDYVRLPIDAAKTRPDRVEGQVLYVDHFGNAITNISESQIERLPGRPLIRVAGCKKRIELMEYYQQTKVGEPLAVIGSTGFLEIAINGGNAATAYDLKLGIKVICDSTDAKRLTRRSTDASSRRQ